MRAKWRTYKEQIKQAEMPDSMKGTSKLPINYDELISDVLKTSNQIERDRIIRPTASAQQTRRLKPDWAKTEEQIEMERDQEIEEVLDFMENFDPEAVKRDAEVQSIVHALMDRVKQIDNGTATVTREGESHSYNPQFANQNRERSFRLRTEKGPVHAAVPSQDGFGKEIGSRQKVRASTAINHTSQEQPLSQSIKHSHQHHQAKPTASGLDMDSLRAKIVKSLAEAIMKSDPVMAQVHSKASLRRLIEGMVAGYLKDNHLVLDRYVNPSWKSENIRRPMTVSHGRDRTQLKNSVQGLPYMYPSPLV